MFSSTSRLCRLPRRSLHRLGAFVCGLFALLLFVFAPLPAHAQEAVPDGHARWIGTWEEVSGRGTIYDFRFASDGQVEVEKSVGTELLRQRLRWAYAGNDIVLSGAAGAVPELTRATLRKQSASHYTLELEPGKTINVRRSLIALSWLHAVFLFAFLVGANEICRRLKWAPYVVFFVLPIVLIPLFLGSGFETLFRWVKLYSAVVGAVFFTLVRFNGLDRHRWARFAVAAILGINILEACTQDYSSGHLANYLNAAAGLLNIVTISRWAGIRRDAQAPHDMLWPGMTVGWILAYDIWNFTFVYLNFPNTALFTLMLVLAPTLAALMIKPGTWMQARAYTLSIYMMYIFSLRAFAEHTLNLQFVVPLPRSETIALALAALSLAANVIYALLHFRWRLTGKAPARVQVGQNESVI